MLTLRPLTEADVTERYLSWFKDERVTRYLEVRSPAKQESIDYIRRGKEGGYFLYAIMVDDTHIGNLKIGPVQWRHKLSDLVTVIGEPGYWGKGYATTAIKQGVELAFGMGIRKLSAGAYGDNIGSIAAYTNAGFHIEAVLKGQYLLEGQPQDRVCLAYFNPAY